MHPHFGLRFGASGFRVVERRQKVPPKFKLKQLPAFHPIEASQAPILVMSVFPPRASIPKPHRNETQVNLQGGAP